MSKDKLRMVRRIKRRIVTREQLSITAEAEYIVGCAGRRDSRVVTLGPLLFFSTHAGDAWVLDPGESLARPLARDGEPLPVGIHETPDQFGVEWTASYKIEGILFVLAEHATNAVRSVAGYPTEEIQKAINQMRRVSE